MSIRAGNLVVFDYDTKSGFDFEISDESLRDDLRAFPRSAEFLPAWASHA